MGKQKQDFRTGIGSQDRVVLVVIGGTQHDQDCEEGSMGFPEQEMFEPRPEE